MKINKRQVVSKNLCHLVHRHFLNPMHYRVSRFVRMYVRTILSHSFSCTLSKKIPTVEYSREKDRCDWVYISCSHIIHTINVFDTIVRLRAIERR